MRLLSRFLRLLPDDNGVDLLFVRSKDCCPNDEVFVFILSSYPFEMPPSFREEVEEEDIVNGAKDTLLPESTLSSTLRANNNCLSSLGLHSSPLDPKENFKRNKNYSKTVL